MVGGTHGGAESCNLTNPLCVYCAFACMHLNAFVCMKFWLDSQPDLFAEDFPTSFMPSGQL